ncbi:hypothetical protein PPL_00911 [Heterostelium album PN500]|uniref:Peptidase M66 domain-containing protein n=1 Tax=Heterostelium pallidum (strain ATCC 26659 / Pp 5 / PN500) TaxID=670386 RepID=D3AYZ2_HETP5|nr:hypothetical protein PPL_00911 [Heterostelium album PN500]EFA85682.1 hypothetical protein PPL_00911 [Heterostelium album PN500]|eukprot:XP_020437789.1 hypothetical protein PPL_00911 [Heterostelium album PN500]
MGKFNIQLILVLLLLVVVSCCFAVKKDVKPANLVPNKASKIRYVQTHVIPAEGLSWSLPKKNSSLHLVGIRDTMILVDFEGNVNDSAPEIAVYEGHCVNPSIILTLNTPDKLPPTESNGTAYSKTSYSVTIPAKYVKPNMTVVVSSDQSSGTSKPNVGQDSTMRLQILPFYMYGANSSNSQPFDKIKLPPSNTIHEIYQTWPVSNLDVATHPIGKLDLPFVIIKASDGGQTYRVSNTNDMRSGYVVMNLILEMLNGIKSTNGESRTNNMVYTPILALNKFGNSVGPGGGLGSIGGFRGTGDASYTGIFIHEAGHSWGLPHSGEAYADQRYPYVNGSLLGSQWGFNFFYNEFLSIYVPTTAEYYKNCNRSHVMDNGKCVKQDSMQGGAGDQSRGMSFTMFPDFDLGIMQQNMEGTTTSNNGTHSISGGLLHYDPTTNMYQQWDQIDRKYVNFTVKNESKGLYGFDSGLPMLRDIEVCTVMIHYNAAAGNSTSTCKNNCTVIYPISQAKGNLMRYIDPRDIKQIQTVTPNTGAIPWYCHGSGCDFTIRATYKDGTQFVKMIPRGLRKYWDPLGQVSPSTSDPNSGDSLILFVENIPADKALSKIELLLTPYAFKTTLQSNATVLVSQNY